MKKFLIFGSVIGVFLFVMYFFFNSADCEARTKLQMIDDEIQKRGYNTNWIVISGKRNRLYNNILPNSAKNSYHLHGKAIDIFVFDIDGDKKFTKKDIEIFKSANEYVENLNPNLIGAVGTYTNKGPLTRHMIHIDVRGYKKSYNY